MSADALAAALSFAAGAERMDLPIAGLVIRAHDASADPMVFRVDDDGGDTLTDGWRLSELLGDLRR